MNLTITLTFLTPLFSRGAYDAPEFRAPSIRGQIHAMMRILGASRQEEKSIFGGVEKPVTSSRVVVRTSAAEYQIGSKPTLPHKKNKSEQGFRTAILPGPKFNIHFSSRLKPLSSQEKSLLRDSIEAWLLMGGLGLRSTRGAGSFDWCSDDLSFKPPNDEGSYINRCRTLLSKRCEIFARCALIGPDGKSYNSLEDAREDVSDTIKGLEKWSDPLGFVKGSNRKTSPLKFRIVKFNNSIKVLAFWDARSEVTGNTLTHLTQAINSLETKPKNIGLDLKCSDILTYTP